MPSLSNVVARCIAGELVLGSDTATESLIDAISDPDDWDLEELRATLAPLAAHAATRNESGTLAFEDGAVVIGDLVIDGNLECNAHTLVVGNVRCSGYVYTGIHCCLVVTGDVDARGIDALRSYWSIGGSVRAETAWFSTYGFLEQGGELRARLVVAEQYFELKCPERVVAGTRIDTEYLPKDAEASRRLAEVIDVDGMVHENADGEKQFDRWELLRRVARGTPVFRS